MLQSNMRNFIEVVANRVFHFAETEKQVTTIKQHTLSKLDETAEVVKKAGDLQAQVLKKTTTYYIGKGLGIVK